MDGKTLIKYGLQEEWQTERVGTKAEWDLVVERAVELDTNKWWKSEAANMVTLERYCKVVSGWNGAPQRYVTDAEVKNTNGAKQMARLRCGANSLMISQGRHRGVDERVKREDRRCRCCDEGKDKASVPTEDECHFLIECPGLMETRQEWWKRLEGVLGQDRWQQFEISSADQKVDFLLGVPGEDRFGGCSADLLQCVLQGVNSMFKARKNLMYKEVW